MQSTEVGTNLSAQLSYVKMYRTQLQIALTVSVCTLLIRYQGTVCTRLWTLKMGRTAGITRARGRAGPFKSQAHILGKRDQSVIWTVFVDLLQASV